ncbi:hypothetical protein [Croceicoccus estronivorus]|uniref:hypothetical protein n=1 Tax=Croceicoccus estronivorus TaxID=1172626 RepID=UPI000AE82C40|nr:hypothetical protein [Croceicoccus estronivorus]
MITAKVRHTANLAAHLSRQAGRLAAAHAEERLRANRDDPGRWRIAHLLWPLQTKGR